MLRGHLTGGVKRLNEYEKLIAPFAINVAVYSFLIYLSHAVLFSLRLNTCMKTKVLIWNLLMYQFLAINRLIIDRLSHLFLSSLLCVRL